MKRNVRKAFTAIKKIFPKSTFPCPDRPDETFVIADGYGEDPLSYYERTYPWIDPRIEKICEANDVFFEWTNDACGRVWEC